MPTETLPHPYFTSTLAEEGGYAEMTRLRSEGKRVSFFNIVDDNGSVVDVYGQPIS